ncbi:hypothetical protein GCM10022217_26270 [Chryseobacterium ginsenosidimutans]|uniref:hypothetical protein n=1 Tax=Chryseobacterium ginsenosidimutans TaxID=687846 RepID=UPI0031CF8C2D
MPLLKKVPRTKKGYDPNYAPVKAAVINLARQTATEGLQHNIHANTLMPWAYSKMTEDQAGGTEIGEWFKANLKPEDVSNAIIYFIHEECKVNGEAFSAQAGRIARIFFASAKGYFNREYSQKTLEIT